MEPASTFPQRRFIPWWKLLVTVSFLTFWNPPTTAQLTVESVPFNATVGEDVLLLAYSIPQNLSGYYWYKGRDTDSNNRIVTHVAATQTVTQGPASSGRETLYPNGSLLIQNVIQEDTGFYTLQTLDLQLQTQEASAEFRVYPVLLKPLISTNNSSPVEGDGSVALTCEPDTQDTTYRWKINDQSLPDDERLQLSDGNRILTLLNVTRNDQGPYVCETWNPVSSNQSDPFSLNISYGPDTPIILPPDSYFHPGTTLNLTCQAASNPPAQYSWYVNGSLLQSTQELVIPNIAANNSGSYTCLAYNPVTGLNRSTEKNVTVTELVTPPSIQASNSTVREGDSVVLTCLSNDTEISIQWIFNNQNLKLTVWMKLSENSSVLTIDPVKREDDGEYQCEVSNLVSSKRSEPIRLYVTPNDPEDVNSGLSGGAIAGIVIGVVAGVALIAALAYFLFYRKIGGASDQHDLTEHKPSVSNHSPGPSDNSPDKVEEIAYSSLNFSALQPKESTSDSSSPTVTETVYSEVKKN